MTGRVNDAHFNAMAGNSVTILHKLIDSAGLGDGNSCPLRLHIEFFKQKQVGFMNRSRHTQSLLQIRNRAHVVNMSMCAHELLGTQTIFSEPGENFLRIIARIDDNRLSRLFVAQDRAVALKKSDRKCFDDHVTRPLSLPRFSACHVWRLRGS